MNRRKAIWAARHPVLAATRLARRVERRHRLPVGPTARTRQALREVLRGRAAALVIGPPHTVVQALPGAVLDVVGTNPGNPAVTVVSDALGAGSLPRRWECVVVTESHPPVDRLVAARSACLPGGVVVVVGTGSDEAAPAPGTEIRGRVCTRGVHVLVSQVTA